MIAVAEHWEVESSIGSVVSVVASLVVWVVASLVAIKSAARAPVRHPAAICGLPIFPTSLPNPGVVA